MGPILTAARGEWSTFLPKAVELTRAAAYFFLPLPGLPDAFFFLAAGLTLCFAEPDPLPPNTRSQPDANFFDDPVCTV